VNALPPCLPICLSQETAEHNVELLKQVLPPHVLASLRGGSRILVEKVPDACLLQVSGLGREERKGNGQQEKEVWGENTCSQTWLRTTEEHYRDGAQRSHRTKSRGWFPKQHLRSRKLTCMPVPCSLRAGS